MRKTIEADHKAEEYARKAEAVGTGGISSDDENAIEKLEANQEFMKAANKAAKKGVPALVALGFSEDDAQKFMTPDHMRRVGFPSYKLSNNRANIKRKNGDTRSERRENGPLHLRREQGGKPHHVLFRG